MFEMLYNRIVYKEESFFKYEQGVIKAFIKGWILGAIGWNLSQSQIKKLDEASNKPLPYPYWHQQGFSERNLFPTS